jgi:RND superfamily putative drug exporter
VITGDAQGKAGRRNRAGDPRLDAPGEAIVGGPAAMLIDQRSALYDRLPWSLAVMGLATFVLLFLLTGSVFIPIKAILMNLLSLTATFGVLVWGFQEGHLAGLLGFDSVGFLALWLPFLVFFLAFGLSMDYEVFLLARIKEEYERTGDNDAAVSSWAASAPGASSRRPRTDRRGVRRIRHRSIARHQSDGRRLDARHPARRDHRADTARARDDEADGSLELVGTAPLRRVHERFGLHEPATAAAAGRASGDGAPVRYAAAGVGVISFDRSSLK